MSETLTQNNNSNLVPYYRFDNFVSGENNHFALAFAKAVSESPGKEYNPLFIYSNVGLGKTHLINAIGNKIVENHPDKQVLYIASAQFEAELVDAIQYGKIDEFRNKYSSLDLLILDDIQFLATKESAQQEFFHAFNELFNKGRQIVISSDRPPRTLSTLEKRLRSRFEGGIITEIMPPNFETRQAILRKKLEEKRMIVPDEVIALLCKTIEGDIRKLEGALKETLAFAKLTNQVVSYEMAKQVIKQKLSESAELDGQVPVVDLESPHDSVQGAGSNPSGNSLKININLPPTPKKKKSLIKEATKNIPLNEEDPSNIPMDDLISDDDRPTKVAMNEPQQAQSKPAPAASNDANAYIEALKNSMDSEGASLTSMFSSSNLNQHIERKRQEQSAQNSSVHQSDRSPTPQPMKPPVSGGTQQSPAQQGPPQPAQTAAQTPMGAPAEQSSNVSLTNIFSSREVKEKIHKIIAIGADNESEIDDTVLGAAPSHRTTTKNVFNKEHKKKLQYELKQFDSILKKINKGKIRIYYLEAFDGFSDNLEKAHEAYHSDDFQHGLDCMRNVKKAYAEMTVNKEGGEAGTAPPQEHSFSVTPMLSRTALLIGGLVGIGGLIALVMWFLFFGSY